MTEAVTKPDWVCHSAADIERFEAWTNAQLDAMFPDPTSASDPRREQILLSIGPVFHDELSAQLKRGRVILAARAGDYEVLAKLADTEELRRLAFAPHGIGRRKGEARPRDLPQLTKACCLDALEDVALIRRIWKRPPPYGFGRVNRSCEPTAFGIAARRYGLKEDTLLTFKSHQRRSR